MIHDDDAAQPAGDAIDDGTSARIWDQLISW